MVSKEVSCTISQFIHDDILDSFEMKRVFSQLSGLSLAASLRIFFLCRFPSMVNTARFSRNLFVVGEDEYRNICAVVTENQPMDIISMEYRVDCKIIFCSSITQVVNYDTHFCFMSALSVRLAST